MNLRKIVVSSVCTAALLISSYMPAFAEYAPSSWATDTVTLASSYKIVPDDTAKIEYTKNITRQEFCRYAVTLYGTLTQKQQPDTLNSHFSDTNDKAVLYAADLGIITGRGNDIFSPDDPITRQEMAIVITRLLSACGIDTSVSGADAVNKLSVYSDTAAVKSWAINPVVFCIKNNLIKGMTDTTLSPDYFTTREQAIVIIYRCFDAFATDEQKNNYVKQPTMSANGNYDALTAKISGDAKLISYNNRTLTAQFEPVAGVTKYKIDIYLDQSNFWYSDNDVYVSTLYSETNTFTFENMRTGKHYKINIYAEGSDKVYTAFVYAAPLYTLDEKQKIVFGGGEINSKDDAAAVMEEICVNVWRINSNGEKYQSTAYLTVHKSISAITKAAFEEIFNGKSKFPIKDVGAYAWRDTMSSGRYSHHNYGTAIDINCNENYCLYKDGSFIGNCWLPGENAYSITPEGEVISIFAKYGFIWGGDEWSNPKDYMHFSYLEL